MEINQNNEKKKREEKKKKKKKEKRKKRRRKKKEKKRRKKNCYKYISQDKIIKKKPKKQKRKDSQETNIKREEGFSNYGGYNPNNLFNATAHYSGNRPILKTEQKECLYCHQFFKLSKNS